MTKKKRRSFTAAQKAAILKRHHTGKVSVSQICVDEKLQPSVFYGWQKQAFENLEASLTSGKRTNSKERGLTAENTRLKKKLARKDEVIAILSEQQLTLKKELGEP